MSDYLEKTADAELFILQSRRAIMAGNYEEALRLARDAMHELEQLCVALEQRVE